MKNITREPLKISLKCFLARNTNEVFYWIIFEKRNNKYYLNQLFFSKNLLKDTNLRNSKNRKDKLLNLLCFNLVPRFTPVKLYHYTTYNLDMKAHIKPLGKFFTYTALNVKHNGNILVEKIICRQVLIHKVLKIKQFFIIITIFDTMMGENVDFIIYIPKIKRIYSGKLSTYQIE